MVEICLLKLLEPVIAFEYGCRDKCPKMFVSIEINFNHEMTSIICMRYVAKSAHLTHPKSNEIDIYLTKLMCAKCFLRIHLSYISSSMINVHCNIITWTFNDRDHH